MDVKKATAYTKEIVDEHGITKLNMKRHDQRGEITLHRMERNRRRVRKRYRLVVETTSTRAHATS